MWHRFPEHGVLGELNPPSSPRLFGRSTDPNKSSLCLGAERLRGEDYQGQTPVDADTVSLKISVMMLSVRASHRRWSRAAVGVKILTRDKLHQHCKTVCFCWFLIKKSERLLQMEKMKHIQQTFFALCDEAAEDTVHVALSRKFQKNTIKDGFSGVFLFTLFCFSLCV